MVLWAYWADKRNDWVSMLFLGSTMAQHIAHEVLYTQMTMIPLFNSSILNVSSVLNRHDSRKCFSVVGELEKLKTIKKKKKMDIRVRIGGINQKQFWANNSKSQQPTRPSCSRKEPPQQNGGNDNNKDKSSTDWDKAWSSFKKQGKKSMLSKFSPNKYVTWNPRRSNYPLSEEVDPIKRAERSNLMLWTSPRFTLGGAIVIVTFLLVYTILAPIK